MHNRFLSPIVFCSGMATLGVELAGSRLLNPFFGSSLLIWANLIGLILIYLTAGYYIGGRWADRDPQPETLYRIVAVAGFFVGVLPFIARPLLSLAVPALENFDAGLGLTSFAGTMLLFVAPVILLGCVTPFALKLATHELNSIGAAAGRLYALSTLGSILGVYVTVFFLIPNLGTRRTFLLFGMLLLALSLAALWQRVGIKKALPFAGLGFIVVTLAALDSGGVVKAEPGLLLLYETESQYNFIQVVEDQGTRLLTVNEGQAFQSAYHPGAVLLGGYWDLMLIVPYLRSTAPPQSLLVVGLAAGTIAKQYAAVYAGIKMDGVEIDPAIVDVGRQLFAMDEPNLTVFIDDGRAFLRRTNATYDVIAVDAYRQPYIPFHLATVEYYRELAPHLSARGVLVVNAARTPNDDRLVTALAATMRQVFPTVILIAYPGHANTLVVASPQPTSLDSFRTRLASLRDPLLRYVADIALKNMRVADATEPVFTDDHAPIENLIHSIILDATIGGK